MKKRKPPVILASSLIVLLGAAVIINLPKRPTADDHGPQAQKPDSSPGASRKTEDAATIKKQLATVSGDEGREAMQRPEDPTGAGSQANPKTATIYIPRPTATKQMPNDASVQAQWYRDQARANSPEGFKTP